MGGGGQGFANVHLPLSKRQKIRFYGGGLKVKVSNLKRAKPPLLEAYLQTSQSSW